MTQCVLLFITSLYDIKGDQISLDMDFIVILSQYPELNRASGGNFKSFMYKKSSKNMLI